MLTLQPSPCPIEQRVEQITELLYPNNWDRLGRDAFRRAMLDFAAEIGRAQQAEIADLKISVIAFCAPWAVTYAEDYGLPRGHLHPQHYDLLERSGARMVDFVRAEVDAA